MSNRNYSEKDVDNILFYAKDNCDSAYALRKVLDALVDYNHQEAYEDDSSDEEQDIKSQASLFLFMLATALTNGSRFKKE